MKNLVPVIGLEIHAQVNTQTKMFCGCANDNFGKEPNSSVCPTCMAFPGALPMPNKEAIEKGIRAALALGCGIPEKCKFDRKNYFYPDLPPGFQISQFDEPLSGEGKVTYEVNGEEKMCRIHHLHLENDAGKLIHQGGYSFCDFNRAGTPLMEIVTQPDLRTAEEASAFAQELARILQFVGSSECDMFKGMMRFDASISLRESEDSPLTPRAEIKNLNSFRALESALKYEIERQKAEWEKRGGPPEKECTVGWVDDLGETRFMRWKETSADYRYFPEPDIPPVITKTEKVEELRKTLPELPLARRKRYEAEIGLTLHDAHLLVDNPKLCMFYEEVAKVSGDAKRSANWMLTEVLGRMKEGMTVAELKFTAHNLGELIKLINEGKISGKQGKEVLDIMWVEGGSPDSIVADRGMEQNSDTGAIEKVIDEILATADGQDAVAKYKSGRTQALGFVVGQVMKAMKGSANPQVVNQILQDKVSKL